MIIYYREITVNVTAPSSPGLGEIWIKPIGTSSYEGYIWMSAWISFAGGGTYIAETDADSHFINVIVSETTPTVNIPGWFWIKESVQQAYLYIFDWMPITGT